MAADAAKNIILELSPVEFMVMFRIVTTAKSGTSEAEWRAIIGAPEHGPQRTSTMSASTRLISKLHRAIRKGQE